MPNDRGWGGRGCPLDRRGIVKGREEKIRRQLLMLSSPDPRFCQSIDHTLLKPDATLEQIDKLCEEAVKYGFRVSLSDSP